MAVLGAILLVAVRAWLVAGILLPLEVCSGSMAPALLGPHVEGVCQDCGAPIACEWLEGPWPAVCPNCGFSGNDLSHAPILSGDRVVLVRSALAVAPLRRWEPVVLRGPLRADQLLVKRIVGLPGETLEIRHGDIFTDGQIQRKDLAQQQAMAILVHDAEHVPEHSGAPPRWRPAREGSRWTRAEGAAGRFVCPCCGDSSPGHPERSEGSRSGQILRFAQNDQHQGGFPEQELVCPITQPDAELDWLVYQHWQRVPGQPSHVMPAPVTDEFVYNRAAPQRAEASMPTSDLMLTLRLSRLEGSGRVWLRAVAGTLVLRLSLDLGRQRFELSREGQSEPLSVGPLPAGRLPASTPANGQVPVTLLWTQFDAQVIVALDGHELLHEPLPESEGPASPAADSTRPFALAGEGVGFTVDRLRVYRDVYYRAADGPARKDGREPARELQAEEYFVLGDDSAISEDSRNWGTGIRLMRQQILGRVLFAWTPSSDGWNLANPLNLARIRWIR